MKVKTLDAITKEVLEEKRSEYVTKMLRAKYNISQRDFAALIQVSQANLCRYEKGKNKPTAGVMKRIIDFAASKNILVTIDDFFGEDNK